jgi:hypothetical protein
LFNGINKDIIIIIINITNNSTGQKLLDELYHEELDLK